MSDRVPASPSATAERMPSTIALSCRSSPCVMSTAGYRTAPRSAMVFAVRVLTVTVSARLRQKTARADMGMDQIFFLKVIVLKVIVLNMKVLLSSNASYGSIKLFRSEISVVRLSP